MKINNFFYLLIFLLINSNSRFGGGGHHFGGRNKGGARRSSHQHRGSSSGHNSSHKKNYSHGSGRNNFNHNYGYGSFGSYGGAAAWGLMGGLGTGLLLGSMMGSGNNGNVTIINSYDEKTKNNGYQISNNYDAVLKNLKSEIEKINNLAKTIERETKEIDKDNNYIPHFIKANFSPYEKTKIIRKTSHELYGDFKKEKIDIVDFKGNQEIKIQIEDIRNNTQPLLKKLISLTDSDTKNKSEAIQNDLIIALKILNTNLLNVVTRLKK
jgi:hypothetical protein